MGTKDKSIDYAITADGSGFKSEMEKAAAVAKEAHAKIEGAFSSMGSTFNRLTGVIGAMTAALAGGVAFKAVIDTTKEWGAQVGALSRQLGVSSAEASAYNVALSRLGISSDVLAGAADKMARQLNSNETAFKTLGIETRNANGSWKSAGELLPDVMDKLRGITNSTQQNIAGQQLFGKAWGEIRPLLKLSNEEMERSRQKVKELNLEVDPTQVKKYKEAMNDIKLVSTSLQVQLGNAMLPVLTKVGSYLGQEGPKMGDAFKHMLQGIAAATMSAWESLKALGGVLGGTFAAMTLALQGNFSGAANVFKDMVGNAKSSVTAIKDIWAHAFDDAPKGPATPETDGGKFIDFEKAKQAKENIVGLWEAQLEERKLKLQETAQAEGRFFQMSKDDERTYWQEKIRLVDLAGKDGINIRKKVATLSLDILKDQFAAEVAKLKAQEEHYKTNLVAKLALAEQEAALIAQKYGMESKEYQEVQGRIIKIKRDAAEQKLRIEEIHQEAMRNMRLAEIDEQAAQSKLDLELHRISLEESLIAEREFEAQRYEIRRQALDEKLMLLEKDPDQNLEAIAKLNVEKEQLALQHEARMREIRNRAAVEDAKYITGIYDGLRSGFERIVNGVLTGTTKLRDIFSSLFQMLGQLVAQTLAKMAADWLMGLIRQQVSSMITALAQIKANAAVAGSAAVASTAAIPVVGPELAPAAGAAAFGTAMSYAAALMVPSAAGGWEVPRDTLAMVHEDEVILPANIGQPLKQQLEGGGIGNGPQPNIVFNGPTWGEFIMVHKRQLVEALNSERRNFRGLSEA